MKQIKLGDLTIKKIVERDQGVHDPLQFFAGATQAAVDAQREWAAPYFLTGDGMMRMSIHSYLVETKHRKVLVDTCIGVHGGPEQQARNQIDETAFPRALKAAGAAPEEIDVVVCTHMHFDHTGWNTRLENGRSSSPPSPTRPTSSRAPSMSTGKTSRPARGTASPSTNASSPSSRPARRSSSSPTTC